MSAAEFAPSFTESVGCRRASQASSRVKYLTIGIFTPKTQKRNDETIESTVDIN